MTYLRGIMALVAIAGWIHGGRADLIRVPEDAATIQQGLDALSPGDTVAVALGEYAEALVAPPLQFWLLGDVPADTGDFERPVVDASLTPDSVNHGCLVLPQGSSATVERMRFRNRYFRPQWIGGVLLLSDTVCLRDCAFDSARGALTQEPHPTQPARVVLDNCQFRNDTVACVWLGHAEVHASGCRFDGSGAMYQLLAGAGSVVENCVFQNTRGVFVTNGGSNLTVRNCLFKEDPDFGDVGYVELAYFSGTFENNVFAHLQPYWNLVNAEHLDTQGVAVFSGNTFLDCRHPEGSSGPQLMRIDAADPVGSPPYLVEYNVMVACSLGDWARGIWARHSGTFTGNRIHDLVSAPGHSAPAIYTDDVGQMIFRENLIYGNGAAMTNASSQVDARWNWWGDSTGPHHATQNPNGQGDGIIGNVDFTPWYSDTSFLLSVPGIGKPLPKEFVLEAYPNPFNSTLHLTLIPSEVGIVKVELFDVLGRQVKELWHGPLAFQKEVTFDSAALASGIYLARVTDVLGRKNLATTKLVLLK